MSGRRTVERGRVQSIAARKNLSDDDQGLDMYSTATV